MSQAEYEFAATEARRGFGGIINSLTGWINHPSAIGRAEYKPYQLHHAVQAGLNVPRTLITNDPKQAKGWCARVGDVVYKPLSAPSWLENGDTYVVFTTPITPDQWGDPAIGRTAHMFQQRLDKEFEVRLTMVDGKAFPAAIHAHSDAARIDWRSDYDALTYSIPTVPQRVLTGARDLLRRLHLRYAALDFIVSPDGRWHFLEVNPNGQYGGSRSTPDNRSATQSLTLSQGRKTNVDSGHRRFPLGRDENRNDQVTEWRPFGMRYGVQPTPIPVPLSDTKYDPDQQVLVVADGQPCAKIERAGTMRVTYPDGQKPGQSDVEKD